MEKTHLSTIIDLHQQRWLITNKDANSHDPTRFPAAENTH